MQKKHFSKIVCVLVCLLFVVPETIFSSESRLPEAPIIIDDQPIRTKYIMREGHLFVPAIFLKHTGAFVDWNEQYRSVVFRAGEVMFGLPIGKDFSDDYFRSTDTWKRSAVPVPALEFAGEPFVPLVHVAKKLGMTVRYDPEIARTFITSNISVKPNVINRVNTNEKLVALTFDDGPDDFYTSKILDVLKEKDVKVTFFVMGKQVRNYPEEMKRIVREGHGIANHTFNHPDMRRIWSGKIREEITTTQRELERVVGRKPDLFRPPFGAITKADTIVLNELGMRNIMWSVDTLDWSGLSGEEIVEIVLRDTKPGGIILQHNFQSDSPLLDGTVEALPVIIDELRKQGYKFVTIHTLLAANHN